MADNPDDDEADDFIEPWAIEEARRLIERGEAARRARLAAELAERRRARRSRARAT